MSTDLTKIVLDIDSASSVAIKVEQRLRALAREWHLEDYLNDGTFVKKVKPAVPENGTLDATRRYEMQSTEFKAEVEALRKLREAAEKSLTLPAYEKLCIMMGRSTSECLEAKEIIDGIKLHFTTLTRAGEEKIVNELPEPWAEGTSLTRHVISQASKVADLKAGGKEMSTNVSKDTLWRSMARVKRNPIYSGLTDAMSVQLDKEDVTYQVFVAKLHTELRKAQYAELNVDTKAAGAAQVVLEGREKGERDKRRQAIQKANKEKFADTPLEDKCPVHVGADHLWKDCTHHTGKKLHSSNRK